MGRVQPWMLVVLAACRMGFEERSGDDVGPAPDAPPGSFVARVTIQHGGGGLGTITGPAGFTCTTGTCTIDVPNGTSITLRGLAAAGSWFEGWTSVCGGNFDCTFVVNADVTLLADFTSMPNRAFVTSTKTDGAIGSIAAADAMCSARATAAGLGGTFIAYLSDSVTNAQSRLSTSRGWVRMDGAPYVDAPTAFSDGKILFPPRLDEYGNDVGDDAVYTGTDWGVTSTDLCVNWTSSLGTDKGGMTSTQKAGDSASASGRNCSNMGRLLCLEIGKVIPVTVRPDTGKLAFQTQTAWAPGAGRASADSHCANEALAAGLPGNFLAAMATTTESIGSRFPAGHVYRRVDGMRLLRSPGIFTADWLDVPPELDQFGARVASDFWTGADRWSSVPTAADNCNDWTDGSMASDGIQHLTMFTDLRSPAKTVSCDAGQPILCLEH